MRKSKRIPKNLIVVAMLVIMLPLTALAQERTKAKLAQTGMKFLSVGMGARQAALADAFTAVEGSSVAMFHNPAGMSRIGAFAEATLGQVNWIADIKQQYAAIAISPMGGDLGVFGLSFQYADYGEIEATILANNTQGYLDLGTFKPNAFAVGLGYARGLSDKFSVGANVKFVRQDLGNGVVDAVYSGTAGEYTGVSSTSEVGNVLDVYAFDFGLIYKTGYKSLTLGMSVRNFAREVKYQKEGFQLPLSFRLGVSMNVFDVFEFDREKQALLVVVDAEHPRDFPEQMKIGAEYVFMNMVSARVGYVGPADEHSISYGLGFQYEMAGTQFALDYAYTPFGIFNNVQRFSLKFGF